MMVPLTEKTKDEKVQEEEDNEFVSQPVDYECLRVSRWVPFTNSWIFESAVQEKGQAWRKTWKLQVLLEQ